MFQSLRQGQTFYVLDKGEEPCLKTMQVVSVGVPQPKFGAVMNPGTWAETVVDVKARDVDGVENDFQKLPSNLSVASFGSMVVSESREAMQAEVEGMLRASQAVLDSISWHRKTIEKAGEMLKELNPQYAKDAERDEQVKMLQQDVDGMKSSLEDIKGMLARMATK